MDIQKSWICARPIAHRGLHDSHAPENSLAAFERAIQRGFAIECDIRPIDDGTIIVFHDDSLGRLTGHDGYASTLTQADLETLRLAGTDERIPTFGQMLQLVAGRTPILIEIKNRDAKIGVFEQAVIDMLRDYTGECAIISFNPYTLAYFREHAPDIPRGQLSTYFAKTDLSAMRRFVLKRLWLNKVSCPDFVAYEHCYLPNKYVTRTRLPVLAWTIRNHADRERIRNHADNIIFEGFDPDEPAE